MTAPVAATNNLDEMMAVSVEITPQNVHAAAWQHLLLTKSQWTAARNVVAEMVLNIYLTEIEARDTGLKMPSSAVGLPAYLTSLLNWAEPVLRIPPLSIRPEHRGRFVLTRICDFYAGLIFVLPRKLSFHVDETVYMDMLKAALGPVVDASRISNLPTTKYVVGPGPEMIGFFVVR